MKKNTPVDNRTEPSELTLAIGRRIRALREKAGMTQGELAEAAGYRNNTSVTFIEQGRNNMKPDSLVLLCKALGTSPNELFGWEDEAR